jgi:hypothetical protein
VILIAVLLNACASIPGRLIPTIEELPDKSMHEKKPTVFIDVNYHTFLKGLHSEPVENITAKDVFIQELKKVTDEAELFASYTLDKFESNGVDYTLQIDMLNHGNYTTAMLAGIVSGLTLTVIPVAAKDNFTLTAKLLDADGNEIKTYVYDDYVRTWFHLFLLPFSWTIKTTPIKVRENMVKNLYNDILQENQMEYAHKSTLIQELYCLK